MVTVEAVPDGDDSSVEYLACSHRHHDRQRVALVERRNSLKRYGEHPQPPHNAPMTLKMRSRLVPKPTKSEVTGVLLR